MSLKSRAPVFPWQILQNSVVQFVKFHEIPRQYYPQIPYIPRPVDVVVLTDNTLFIYYLFIFIYLFM